MKTTDLIKSIEEKGIIEVTGEQSAKGFKWLYNLYKTPIGKERKNNPFGYRENGELHIVGQL